jgi:hypothetical protein
MSRDGGTLKSLQDVNKQLISRVEGAPQRAKIKAQLFLKDDKDRSMEELIVLLADVYESQEKDRK